MRKLLKRQRPDRRGAALVEAAFILPILFLVTLGIIEFGRAMMVAQMVTTAAREGARTGILTGKTNADVTNVVNQFMLDAVNLSPDKFTMAITVTPASGNPDPMNEVGNANTGDLVEVVVRVPFDNVSYISPDWLAGRNLTGQCTMSHE